MSSCTLSSCACSCHPPKEKPPTWGLCRLCGANGFVRFLELSRGICLSPRGHTSPVWTAWCCLECTPAEVTVAAVPDALAAFQPAQDGLARQRYDRRHRAMRVSLGAVS